MFSGKTTELLHRLAAVRPECVQVFKHVIDCRYGVDAVVSHARRSWPAVAIESAQQILARLQNGTEVVAVDEAHFFPESLVDMTQCVADRGVHVMLTSLDRDSWGRPFRVAQRLCSTADEAIVRQAVCACCGGMADHTQRLTPIIDTNMVGGPESYEARCWRCWTPPPEPPPY
jgi:thymidine kinase